MVQIPTQFAPEFQRTVSTFASNYRMTNTAVCVFWYLHLYPVPLIQFIPPFLCLESRSNMRIIHSATIVDLVCASLTLQKCALKLRGLLKTKSFLPFSPTCTNSRMINTIKLRINLFYAQPIVWAARNLDKLGLEGGLIRQGNRGLYMLPELG